MKKHLAVHARKDGSKEDETNESETEAAETKEGDSTEGRYLCDICRKAHCSPYNVKRHKLVHAREIHECDPCDKKFTMKFLLEKHRIMHTGEKPNICDICQRPFRDATGLMRHKR